MTKHITTIATPAEESGWDLWQYGKGDTLVFKKTIDAALNSNNLSSNGCLALPLKNLASLPLIVSSIDKELCQGAAQMALERAAFIPEEDNDHLWDSLRVDQKDEQTLTSAIALSEAQLDPADKIRHLSHFDLHARLLTPNTNADSVGCWKEQGQWVLAAYRNRIPFYTEPLGGLPTNLPHILNLLTSQLQLKGITFAPEKVHLWKGSALIENLDEVEESFTSSTYQLLISDRPQPVLPKPPLDLIPTVVRDHKQALKSRASFLRSLAFISVIYLAAMAFLWWYKKDLNDQLVQIEDEIKDFTPQYQKNEEHLRLWEQLDDITQESWPLRLYLESVKLLPPGKEIRFTLIELQEAQIVIQGTSASFGPISKFDEAIEKSEYFRDYQWVTPPARKDPKTSLWTFKYEGKPLRFVQNP